MAFAVRCRGRAILIRVLVVEDEPLIARLLIEVLTAEDCRIVGPAESAAAIGVSSYARATGCGAAPRRICAKPFSHDRPLDIR